jgi:hypothetical protein
VNRETELEIFGSRAGNYAVLAVCDAAGGQPVVTLDFDVEDVLSVRQLSESPLLVSVPGRPHLMQRSVPVQTHSSQAGEFEASPAYSPTRCSSGDRPGGH